MKKLTAILLAVLMCSAMLLNVSAYIENDMLGETKKDYEGWGYDGNFDDILKLDGIKEPEYNDGLIMTVDKLIEGEDTGASAKVYIIHDTSLRIFVEVTDKELVDPTQDQQVEEVTGVQSFDCVQIILNTDNGNLDVSPWFQDAPDDDDGSYPWRVKGQTPYRIYRMDHTNFLYNEWMDDGHKIGGDWEKEKQAQYGKEWKLDTGKNALWVEADQKYYYIDEGIEWNKDEGYYVYKDTTTPLDLSKAEEIPYDENGGKYFSNADMIGWGGTLDSSMKCTDPNDPNTAVAVQKTENGYNVEICAMMTAYAEGTEFGVNVVLTDVYDGGEKKSAYSLNGAADPMDWKEMDYFILGNPIAMPYDDEGNILDEDGRAAYIAAQKGEAVDTTEDTGADTSKDTSTDTAKTTDTKSVDNNKDDGGMNPVIIGVIIAVVVIIAVAVIVVVMKKKKTE